MERFRRRSKDARRFRANYRQSFWVRVCITGYADKFGSWTADEIEALRCDVVETATEEELLAEIERRRRAGLLPKGTSNDGFSDLVDDLWGKLDTDPDR